jgi:hypothetical protein
MLILNNFITLNEPSSNVYREKESILPERFNSTSHPKHYSIVNKEFSSISEPDKSESRDPENEKTDQQA